MTDTRAIPAIVWDQPPNRDADRARAMYLVMDADGVWYLKSTAGLQDGSIALDVDGTSQVIERIVLDGAEILKVGGVASHIWTDPADLLLHFEPGMSWRSYHTRTGAALEFRSGADLDALFSHEPIDGMPSDLVFTRSGAALQATQ